MQDKFKAGDEVALSATFLRSIDPNAAAGWPTTFDPGIGVVIDSIDCGGVELVDVEFTVKPVSGQAKAILRKRRFNAFNLVHRKDIQNEAMRAEHRPRKIGIDI